MAEFKRGDIILESEPFAYALNDQEKGRYCDYCFKCVDGVQSLGEEPSPKLDIKKCSQCKAMYFCDRACQSKAWKLFHREECVKLSKVKLTVTGVFVARVFFKLLNLKKFPESVPFEMVGTTRRTFASLVSHSQEIRNDKRNQPNLKILVEMIRQFSPEHFTERNSNENKDILEEIFCKMTINSFELGNWEMMPIGVGLYLGTSYFDHSCDPDAFVSFEGTTSVVRALKSIPHSDLSSIKVSYIDFVDAKKDRLKSLREQYYFDCTCKLCSTSLHETEKECITNLEAVAQTNIISKTEVLLSEAKHLHLMSRDRMEMTLKKCLIIFKVQKAMLGELNIHRTNLALLGFDLAVHLKEYEAAIEFGQESLRSLHFFKGKDPSVGILMFKLGKMLMLKDELEKSAELLRPAKEILLSLFGNNHRLLLELSACLIPLEMELLMRDREPKKSKRKIK